MPTHHLKKNGQSMCFRSLQNAIKESILSEIGKTYHDHQNSAQEMEGPENELLKEIIVNRGTTYSLRSGRFARGLS